MDPASGAKVMVATRPVDFRKAADSLAALVAAEYGGKPYSGVIYVFRAKNADRIMDLLRFCAGHLSVESSPMKADEIMKHSDESSWRWCRLR